MRILLSLCLLIACAPSLSTTVESLVASGDVENALDVTIAASRAGNPKAAELLPAVAEDRYDDLLDRATEAEADDNLLQSLEHYDALIALEAEVVAAGGPKVVADLPATRQKVAERAALKRYSEGEVAFADGRFRDAADAFLKAERLAQGHTKAMRILPHTFTELGHQARKRQQYRDAIAHYDEAVALGAGETPRIWSAAIHAALGRHALSEGACRKAVSELTLATALPFDVDLGGDLDEARACAQREVVVHPLEDMVEGGIDTNLGILLMDQLNHHLRAHGSRYLKLLAKDSRAARRLPDAEGRRYDVRGHLTRIDVEEGEPTTDKTTGAGVILVPCNPGEVPACREEVRVDYQLTTERLAVDIAGAIEVIDPVSGEQVLTRPLEVRLSRTRYTVADAKATDVRGFGVQAPIGLKTSDRSIGMSGPARTHFTQSEPLPDADKVIDEAMVRLASEAADAVLHAIDVEQPLPDPETLRLVTPVARAEDLVFRDAMIEEERPTAEERVEEVEMKAEQSEEVADPDGPEDEPPTP